jgi:hypothetical protein
VSKAEVLADETFALVDWGINQPRFVTCPPVRES